jgi:hypothetical protein
MRPALKAPSLARVTGIARLAAGIALVVGAGSSLFLACGGTTGQEGLPKDDTSAMDATVAPDAFVEPDLDAGLFDVTITYIDRDLPEVAVVAASDAAAMYPWPNCPPFIPVDGNGNPVTLGSDLNQIPSEYTSDGGIEPAPDGSACASYPWLGSLSLDQCVTSEYAGAAPPLGFYFLPPCNWAAEAGVATAGPGAGLSRYINCINLYQCMVDSGCGLQPSGSCICAPDAGSLSKHYTDLDPNEGHWFGAYLNQVYQYAVDTCVGAP